MKKDREAATKIQVAFDALNRMDMSVSEYIDTVKTHKVSIVK